MSETALQKLDDAKVNLILANVDTTGLTAAKKHELALVLAEDYETSKQGFNFKPQRFKVNKDNQTFTDPLGNAHEEIRGVVVFKQKTRGFWDRTNKEDKVPLCSSYDGVVGMMRTGNGDEKTARPCTNCPNNQWGSASTSDEERKGKACKEMRRAFIIPTGQFVPIMISLPPTSLSAWDNFWSARITQGIADLQAEAVLGLMPGKVGGYDVSIIKPKNGAKVAPRDMLELNKIKKQFADTWAEAEITDDDYDESGSADAGGDEAAKQPVVDDGEPY